MKDYCRPILFIFLALVLGTSHAEQPDQAGVWKAFVPEDPVGGLGSHDPIDLIAGKQITADRSLKPDVLRIVYSGANQPPL